MIETYTWIENLIILELKKYKFSNIREKDCIIIYTDIKTHHEITFEEFTKGIQALVDKNLLIFKISDSGIKFYQLSKEFKTMLDIK